MGSLSFCSGIVEGNEQASGCENCPQHWNVSNPHTSSSTRASCFNVAGDFMLAHLFVYLDYPERKERLLVVYSYGGHLYPQAGRRKPGNEVWSFEHNQRAHLSSPWNSECFLFVWKHRWFWWKWKWSFHWNFLLKKGTPSRDVFLFLFLPELLEYQYHLYHHWGGGGGGYSIKFSMGRLCPKVQTLTL